MASQKTRNDRQARGLCLQCGGQPGVNPLTGRRYRTCDKCRVKMEQGHARWQKRVQERRVEEVGTSVQSRLLGPVKRAVALIRTNEVMELPEGSRIPVLAWYRLRQHLFIQLRGPRRLIAQSMLALMGQFEIEAQAAFEVEA